MKRHILIAGCTIVVLLYCDYAAALVFKDGGTHIIDYAVYEPVYVDQSAPGVGTKVDLLDGGLIQAWLDAYEDSRVNILAGRVSATVNAYGASHITRIFHRILGFFDRQMA